MSNLSVSSSINNVSGEWFKPKIDKKTLKALSKRSDFEGWKHIIIFFSALSSLGLLSVYFWNTWFFIIFYLAYCTVWGGADAIWHECGHRTAFKTRKINDFFYNIASFMNNFEPVRWRWSHSLHHSYTASLDPHDYEVDNSIFANHSIISFLFIFVPGSAFSSSNSSIA